MVKKGNKVWWTCKRYNIMVYKDMCTIACFPTEIAACEDRKNKPDRAEAPIAENLRVRLTRVLGKKKKEKENGDEK